MTVGAGQYYPRIGRGSWPIQLTPFHKAISSFQIQLDLMVGDLSEIFHAVEPNHENYKAYGHKSRNLLLLACTEFESQCIGILEAHQVEAKGKAYSTNDYVRLLNPLKLDDYEVSLKRYPDSSSMKPFENWSSAQPTQSLAWYSAYNRVKHNREESFHEATLRNAILAVKACACIYNAQVAADAHLVAGIETNMFKFDRVPIFDFEYEMPSRPNSWVPILYPF